MGSSASSWNSFLCSLATLRVNRQSSSSRWRARSWTARGLAQSYPVSTFSGPVRVAKALPVSVTMSMNIRSGKEKEGVGECCWGRLTL